MSEEFNQIKQTKGTFEVRGVLFNMKAENAFKELKTTNGKQMRMMNLGLRISDKEVMFLSMNGMEQEFVHFSKQGKKGEKPEMKKVEWAKRNRFNETGFRMIGVALALHKDEETGKNEDVKTLHSFDAIEYIHENAEDNMSVFVKGTIEVSSFEDKNTKELKKTTKFIPNAIYLTKEPVDFQSEKFEKSAEFAQPVIFNGVRREAIEGTDAHRFYLDVSMVGWKSFENVSLETTEQLAKIMKEKVKPFNGITVTGKIESSQVVEVVEAEVWGEKSNVGKAKTSAKVIMIVTGARPETINTEDYSKKIVEAYQEAVELEKKNKDNQKAGFESQESGGWGDKGKVKEEEESGW